MSKFNLRSIKTVESFELEIKDEQGNPTGVIFTLAGPNHPARKAVQMAANRKLIAQANKTGKVQLPDPEDVEKDKVKNLVSFTLGWTGYGGDDGLDVPYTRETATALYSDPEMMWLADQVEAALGEKDRFTKRADDK